MGRPRKTNKHLPKYVTENNGSYWYKGPGMPKAVRIARVGDDAALYRYLAKVAEGVTDKPLVTLADCFDRYEREVVPTFSPRTQRDYRRHFALLRKWCGDVAPDDLRPRDVGQFLDVSKGKISRNKTVSVLSAVYTKAVGRWYVAERNPCKGVERNESKPRTRYVNDAEFAAVYALMPPRQQIAMDLALITGQRQGDLLRLKWDAVTEAGVLFRQGKTGKRLMVQMSPALRTVLDRAERMIPHIPREYVLRTRKGRPYTSEGFRAIWQRVMRRAVRTGKVAERFTFHDLRAKSVSDAATLEEAFERAGHTSMTMTRSVYDRGVRSVKPLK